MATSKAATTFVFGGLCAGTFGLGCWQTQRYFNKVDMVNQRIEELQMPPEQLGSSASTGETTGSGFRRVVARGTFHHKDEVYVGPRGPPPGAMAQSGPMSGRSAGGMGVSPQGYFIITPFERSDNEGTILVNRGWIPQQYLHQSNLYNKPSGLVNMIGVTSSMEQPRFLSPEHPNKKKLLWMDRSALEEATQTTGTEPILITETSEVVPTNNNSSSDGDDERIAMSRETFPVKPNAEGVGEFKVLPATHAGYGFTWFGLSGAGIIMTRKLLTKGRW